MEKIDTNDLINLGYIELKNFKEALKTLKQTIQEATNLSKQPTRKRL